MPGAQGGALATTPASTSSEVSLASADFDITSASNLLEAEMREAVVGTATAAVGEEQDVFGACACGGVHRPRSCERPWQPLPPLVQARPRWVWW